MVTDNSSSNTKGFVDIDFLCTTNHLRQKHALDKASITVLTDNCSVPTDTLDWTRVGWDQYSAAPAVLQAAASTDMNIDYHNYYSRLDFGADNIAINLGVSLGFEDEDTSGTDRTSVDHGITIESATCDQCLFVLLPDVAREFHVMPQGKIKRPLLSVGKACNTCRRCCPLGPVTSTAIPPMA